jgi:hypothetical protein
MNYLHKNIAVIIVLIILSGCAGSKYITPTSLIRPDSVQKITDDDIKNAYKNKAQLIKPIAVALYDLTSMNTDLADSLHNLIDIKSVYNISPVLMGENYGNRYSRWYSYYRDPSPVNMKQLRLLAAEGGADLLIVMSTSHNYHTSTNILSFSYFFLIPALFVPGLNCEMTTEIDLFFIDVRNGYLYGTYHDLSLYKNNFVTIYYEDNADKIARQELNKMMANTMKNIREILAEPRFYIDTTQANKPN